MEYVNYFSLEHETTEPPIRLYSDKKATIYLLIIQFNMIETKKKKKKLKVTEIFITKKLQADLISFGEKRHKLQIDSYSSPCS